MDHQTFAIPRGKHPSRESLARLGARAALRTRSTLGISLNEAICVFDVADRLGLDVWFVDVPSLEGMYVTPAEPQSKPRILISADRPPGRQASTAGHELGHHVFGHGTRIDQYVRTGDSTSPYLSSNAPDERLANAFGAFILMPRAAVERGFRERGFSPHSPSPKEILIVSGWLGVGYSTLVHHLLWSLRILSARRGDLLLKKRPKQVREEILGDEVPGDLLMVDPAWTGCPIDMQVGDIAILPPGATVEGSDGRSLDGTPFPIVALRPDPGPGGTVVVHARCPGIGRASSGEWAAFIRVSRRRYVGRQRFRHLEPAGSVPDGTSHGSNEHGGYGGDGKYH